MRISHSEFGAARHDPAAWLRAKQTPVVGGRRLGYAQAVKLAIYKFHSSQGDRSSTLNHFDQMATRHFRNAAKITEARLQLDAYIEWAHDAGVIVADHRIRLNLALHGDIALGGEVSRIDIGPNGYRAVLLSGRAVGGWKQELRMPLIQVAVADRYDRTADEVSVAIQMLDGGGLDEASYSQKDRNSAFDNAVDLAKQLHRLQSRPGFKP